MPPAMFCHLEKAVREGGGKGVLDGASGRDEPQVVSMQKLPRALALEVLCKVLFLGMFANRKIVKMSPVPKWVRAELVFKSPPRVSV